MPYDTDTEGGAIQGLISVAGRTRGLLSDHADHLATPNGYLLVVADGNQAPQAPPSRIAIQQLKDFLSERRMTDPDLAITQAFHRADWALQAEEEQQSDNWATATALLLETDAIHVGHVGDGRAYRIRGNLITRLTSDQTFTRAMIQSGVVEINDARRRRRHRHSLLRALGNGDGQGASVMVSHLDLMAGDIVVLCSDGLCDVLDDMEVGRLVETFFPPDAAAHALIDLALERGAGESLSTIVVRVG